MTKLVRVIILMSVLVLLLALNVGVAFAHPTENAGGGQVDPNRDGLERGKAESGGANATGFGQQGPHNPTCAGHTH